MILRNVIYSVFPVKRSRCSSHLPMEAPHGSNTSKGNGWVATLPHLNHRRLKAATAELLIPQSMPNHGRCPAQATVGCASGRHARKTTQGKRALITAAVPYQNGRAFQCSNQRADMSKVTSETSLEEPVAILGFENCGF